ncbi:amidohydrolase family protein [Halopseudomonas pachastrellae]|uniref:amidohydrolase family protein n=1 Tax=Halopseudomonas pachastrellae TaxID=254161 RepID=UPI003D7F126F
MTIKQGLIDVHHHIIPPLYAEALRQHGLDLHAGMPLPKWSVEQALEVMDINGIQYAVTSLTTPGAHLGGGVQQAATLARQCNEYAAELRQQQPTRFGSFALLPLPFTEASCAEAIYALDVLGAEGVVVFGSNDGVFLGDPSLDELMAELNRRAAVVFVHPNLHKTSEELGSPLPGFLVEFLCDTTRAAVNLIFNGTLQRYPRIRWILAHGGGFLPAISGRLQALEQTPHYQAQGLDSVDSYLRGFYYDTALSPSRYSQVALKHLVPQTQILFGSDFPFAPAPLTALQRQTLDDSPLWDESQRYAIYRGNAIGLWPALRQADEQSVAEPIVVDEPFALRLKRSLSKPVASLVDGVRSR